MIKKISLLALATLPLLALDLQVKPEQTISVSSQEIDQTVAKMLGKKVRIEKKDAQTVIYDNKVLANALLKADTLSPETLIDLRLSIEETLADLYVKQNQEKVEINNTVLESYYKTNPKEFQEDQLINTIVYNFNDYESASTFYNTFKTNALKSEAYAKEHNITNNAQEIEIGKISPMVKDALRDFEQKEYLTAPLFFQKKFIIVLIKDIKPNTKKSYLNHVDYITNVLKQKTLLDARKALLNKLKESK